jgi:NAD(P)-dependent dehydrogenase (short-subunit alcohol dehydrogenase family)
MGSLEGKRALVTGGTTGLGLAIAERFRREGARVVITGRDHDLGERAERALGPDTRFVAADAADPPAPARPAAEVLFFWLSSPHVMGPLTIFTTESPLSPSVTSGYVLEG